MFISRPPQAKDIDCWVLLRHICAYLVFVGITNMCKNSILDSINFYLPPSHISHEMIKRVYFRNDCLYRKQS